MKVLTWCMKMDSLLVYDVLLSGYYMLIILVLRSTLRLLWSQAANKRLEGRSNIHNYFIKAQLNVKRISIESSFILQNWDWYEFFPICRIINCFCFECNELLDPNYVYICLYAWLFRLNPNVNRNLCQNSW